MMAVGVALAFSGFSALSLGMDRHYEQVFEAEPGAGRKIVLRLMGWLLLGLALVPAMQFYGTSVGIAVWFGELTIGALVAALLLSYQPRWLPLLTLAAAVISVLCLNLLSR